MARYYIANSHQTYGRRGRAQIIAVYSFDCELCGIGNNYRYGPSLLPLNDESAADDAKPYLEDIRDHGCRRRDREVAAGIHGQR